MEKKRQYLLEVDAQRLRGQVNHVIQDSQLVIVFPQTFVDIDGILFNVDVLIENTSDLLLELH